MNDSLGDRMKEYEGALSHKSMSGLPLMIRLDGKGFHKYTQHMNRPFDAGLTAVMIDTTKFLVELSGARCGYTQSDEISLCLLQDTWKQELYLGGKFQKLCSILAGETANYFNRMIKRVMVKYYYKYEDAVFDCRVWNVPTKEEAVNCFVWREQDAARNSVQMLARSLFSHNECMNKDNSELQEMIFSKGDNWNDLEPKYKRGTYVRKVKTVRRFKPEELMDLPEHHEARKNPELLVERSDTQIINLPKLSSLTNREAVLFEGAEPCES